MKSLIALLLATAAASLVACGGPPKKVEEPAVTEVVTDAGAEEPPPAPATSFEKLGKREGLQSVVDLFLKNATVDPAAKSLFSKYKGDRLEDLKVALVEHLCKGTGGDCTPAEATGTPLKINDKQFEALKADLKAAMDEQKISEENQGDLTKAFEALRDPLAIVLNQKK